MGAGLGRRPSIRGGGSAPLPVNLVAPVLSGAVTIGASPAVAAGTWTGSPTLTYTLRRDGVPISGLVGVSEATIEAFAYVAADIGPSLTLAEIPDGDTGRQVVSNAVTFAHATYLPNTADWYVGAGLTLADGDTTVDSWASSRGGVSCTLTAPGSTNRPAWSGGRVVFDGNDNVLIGTFTKGSALTDRYCGIIGQRVALSTAGDIWIGYSLSGSFVFGLRDNNAASFQLVEAAVATSVSTTDPDGVDRHYSGGNDGTNQRLYVNDVVEDTDLATPTTRADGNQVVIGGTAAGAAASNINVAASHFGPWLDDTHRAHLHALNAYLTGVST